MHKNFSAPLLETNGEKKTKTNVKTQKELMKMKRREKNERNEKFKVTDCATW
jgi:hypothetical protein